MGEVAEYSKNRICSDKLNEHNYVGVDNLLQNREGKKLSGYVPSEGKMTEYIVNDIFDWKYPSVFEKNLAGRLHGRNKR
ncbi:hypothetical protein ACSAWF_00335 [Neisseria gonorrhoeae]|uniref:hypothetical protein n=1 Tax=Neisseria gonorrhoeae TaxID=485 RepID=UPI003EBA1DD2